jgi:Family of unknown function (DUF6011)
MSTNFTSAADARRFIRGGKAILTIRSHKSGEHRTFRVSKKDADSPFFVGLLTGPDNGADYTYMGVLTDDGRVRLTKASKMGNESVSVRAWNYVATKLHADSLPPDADVLHEGRCGCCGRALTVPESIERGIGPECWSKMVGG